MAADAWSRSARARVTSCWLTAFVSTACSSRSNRTRHGADRPRPPEAGRCTVALRLIRLALDDEESLAIADEGARFEAHLVEKALHPRADVDRLECPLSTRRTPGRGSRLSGRCGHRHRGGGGTTVSGGFWHPALSPARIMMDRTTLRRTKANSEVFITAHCCRNCSATST